MIALISDIHANLDALNRVLDRIDEMNVAETFCLGDVVGYHTDVNQCCNELRSRGIRTVMGNHDYYLANAAVCTRSQVVNHCISFQRQVIEAENLMWLSKLPTEITAYGVRMVHGGWRNHTEEYLVPSYDYFEKLQGTAFASGHTHKPVVWSEKGKTYCNPGSVGQPRDSDPRASFATFDGRGFRIHRVEYDSSGLRARMHQAGFPPRYYENLSLGLPISSGESPRDQESSGRG